MAKVFVSFVVGLAVAALAFSLLNEQPASGFVEQPGTAPLRQSVETADPGAEGSSEAVPNETAADSDVGEIDEPVDERSADVRPPADARPPPDQPIYLSPEFDWLAKDPQKFRSHDSVQREPYDVDWAPAMEARLAGFLRENPEITQTYGYPTSIVCRTSQCELLFVAYDLEKKLNDEYIEYSLLSHFHKSISGFFEKSEFEQFRLRTSRDAIFFLHHSENGVTGIAWWLVSQDRLNHPGGAFARREREAADPPPVPNR